MARSKKIPARQSERALVPPTVTLALWRLRRTCGLLLVTGMGMIAAVLLACTVPLFSDISMTAGLRGILTSSTQNADIVVHSSSQRIDASVFSNATRELDQEFQNTLGPFLSPVQFSLQTTEYSISSIHPGKLQNPLDQMQLVSMPMEQAATHVRLLSGRLPQVHSSDIEIVLTQESANRLGVTVGSVINVQAAYVHIPNERAVEALPYHVVGIIAPPSPGDSFWHGISFVSVEQRLGPGAIRTNYAVLASTDTFVSALSNIARNPALNGLVLELPVDLQWYYRLDASQVTIDNLDSITQGITGGQVDISNINLNQDPYIQNTQVYLPTDIIQRYRDRISVARLPIVSLLVLVLGLVLYFVSMMTDLLVDRQSEAIAILRSRGASRRQIFGSLVIQSIGLALVALVIGSLLAVPIAYLLLRQTLASGDQGVLSLLTSRPLQAAWSEHWYALATAVVAVVAMTVSVLRATRQDVLALRREAARTTRRPLWQRLNLDIVVAVIMLVGYGFASYLTTSGILSVQLRLLLLTPLRLVGSVALLLVCLLLFLRFFPLLLAGGSALATRARGATALLALAHMSRAPRQAMRMTLLLALATAFAIFTLVMTASQAQRTIDVTNFQGGADFSGTIVGATIGSSFSASLLDKDTALYNAIPGVRSATLGYMGSASAGGSALSIPVELRAVDASAFAQTAIWTAQDSSQSLQALMDELVAQRTSAVVDNALPAIVDSSAWNMLRLAPNAPFTLNFPDGLVNFIAIAAVQHIPTVNDSAVVTGSTSDVEPAGGVLVDYNSFAAVYARDFASTGNTIPMNYAWLRTKDDAASLASVRHAISSGNLELSNVYDRRATFEALHREPLYLDLIGVLALGATTALLLALVGNLLVSWLSVRSRLTTFAVLRALGTTPGEIASVLTWEQALTYSIAIVLGIAFGAILSALIVPAMVFTSVAPGGSSSDTSSGAFYVVQSVPPIQLIIPPSLGIALVVLVVIYLCALGLMVLVVSQPSISQTLRLNED